jgi:hypothetical protein
MQQHLLDKSPTIIEEVKMRSAQIRFLVLLPLVVLLGMLAWLAIPGTPSRARSLRFVGYIPLQRTGLLNVLDYLTVQGNEVFVAGISSGDVTRISTHADRSLEGLAVLHGPPSAHGVAIDPATGLALCVSQRGQYRRGLRSGTDEHRTLDSCGRRSRRHHRCAFFQFNSRHDLRRTW